MKGVLTFPAKPRRRAPADRGRLPNVVTNAQAELAQLYAIRPDALEVIRRLVQNYIERPERRGGAR